MSLLNTKSPRLNYLSRIEGEGTGNTSGGGPNISYPSNASGNIGTPAGVEVRGEAEALDDESGTAAFATPSVVRTT